MVISNGLQWHKCRCERDLNSDSEAFELQRVFVDFFLDRGRGGDYELAGSKI